MVVQLLNCMHVCRFGVVDSTASKGHSFQKQYKHYAVSYSSAYFNKDEATMPCDVFCGFSVQGMVNIFVNLAIKLQKHR